MGTDVLGHHIRTKLGCLSIEDGTAMLSQNVSNKLSTYAPQPSNKNKDLNYTEQKE